MAEPRGPEPRGSDTSSCQLQRGKRDLTTLDLDDVDLGHDLAALLALRAFLHEADIAVDALHMHLPERLADGLGLGLAGQLDRRRDRLDTVMAAEALRQAREFIAALLPCGDEVLGDLGVLRLLREPRGEEEDVVGAVGGIAVSLHELDRLVSGSVRDTAQVQAERLRLLEGPRERLWLAGDDQ